MAIFRNNEYKNLIIIFLVALSLRMLLFVAVGPWQDNVVKDIILTYEDAPSYHYVATQLAQGKPIIAVLNKPLYAYFVALSYYLFGYEPYMIIIFQIFMGSVTCVFLYKIARKIFNEKIALFAGLFLAFEYSSILYTNHLLTETMFILFFIIHIYFLQQFLMEKKYKMLIYSAIFLGVCTNVRSATLYFPIFLIWPFFLYFRKDFQKGILSFLILVTIFLSFVIPWSVRNYVVAGEFAFSVDSGDQAIMRVIPNIMNIIKPPDTTIRKWTAEEKRIMVEEAEHPDMSVAAVVRKYRKDGITALLLTRWQKQLHEGTLSTDIPLKMQDRKRGYVNTDIQPEERPIGQKIMKALFADTKRFLVNEYRFFATLNSGSYPEILGLPVYRMDEKDWDKGFVNMVKVAIQEKSNIEQFFMYLSISVLLFLYSAACYGIYASIRKKEFTKLVLFITTILYFIIPSVARFSESMAPRYRAPTIPFLVILSCYGMAELKCRFRKPATGDAQALDSTL